MNKFKKLSALATAGIMAVSFAGCEESTSTGMNIDGTDVRAGIFIFYTMSAYYEASNLISEDGTDTTDVSNIKNAHIDNVTSKEWIQNKAEEYCTQFIAIEREFDALGEELTDEENSEIDKMLEYYTSSDGGKFYTKNGISSESLRDIMEIDYKRQHVFKHYYGFGSEKGMSEDELKDYFNDNYARVEYVTIDLKDSEGNILKGNDKKKLIKLAQEYADEVNKEPTEQKKLYKMDEIREEYNDYKLEKSEEEAALTATTESGTITTTTTTTTTSDPTETTTTTTTNPFANEALVEHVTVTTAEKADISVGETGKTTTATEPNYVPSKKANEFIFNEAKTGVASVVEDTEAVYVILRADLYERLTDDDWWSENYILNLQNQKYGTEFSDFIDELAKSYTVKRNEKAFKRYEPFSLDYEQESNK